MKKILFGIDGGGSNTKLLITDFGLNKLAESSGGATNFNRTGYEEAVLNVENLIEPFLAEYDDADITLVIGTAGAGRKTDAEQFEAYLKESITNVNMLKVVSDAEITLKGAYENEDGAILIAGTGSILYYKLKNQIGRVGGFGRLIGDEGSGYSIGRKGINLLSKMLDGRIEKSLLADLAREKFGIDSPESLITKIYKENFDIPFFAEIVIKAAENEDSHSQKIIEVETNELVVHLKAVIINEGLKEINLVLTGGLVSENNFFKSTLIRKIERDLRQVKIVTPKHSPEFGAVLIAKEIQPGNE